MKMDHIITENKQMANIQMKQKKPRKLEQIT